MRKTCLLLMLALCMLLTGCAHLPVPFNPETEGAVDVIVRSGETLEYFAVSGDGRTQEAEPFESDEIIVCRVDADCFDTYKDIDEEGRGKFVNRLADVSIWDESGEPVPRTETLMRILQAASWLEHDLFNVRILRAGEAYFLYVQLNVNWWTPCTLYWYDPVRCGLVELCEFDSKETVGLRVRDLSRLSGRPVVRAAWRVSNPLRSFCDGRYELRMQGDQVNLVSGDDAVIRDVTGYWSVHGRETGFVAAGGYHVLNEASGEIASFAGLDGMPEAWAARFADHVTELRFARRPGAVRNPLLTWCGGRYQLCMEGGSVNLTGPDGVIARRVTGYWSLQQVGGENAHEAGFLSGDGYHVIDLDTGECTHFTSLEGRKARWVEYFAEEGFCKMNRFGFAYGLSDFTPMLAELRSRFEACRTLCSEAASVISRHPDWLAGANCVTARGVWRAVPQYDGWSTAEPNSVDWPQVQSLFEAMQPRYVGGENGAVYLHYALVADNGRAAPARLYYIPEEAAEEVCAAAWSLWESLGGGWYLAALTE